MLMAKLLAGIGCAASWSPSALARKTMTPNVSPDKVVARILCWGTVCARHEAHSIYTNDERLCPACYLPLFLSLLDRLSSQSLKFPSNAGK